MKFKVENPALNFVLMFCVWLDRFIVQIKKNHPHDRNQFYPGFDTGFSGKYIFTQGSSTQKKNGSGIFAYYKNGLPVAVSKPV